MKRCPFRPDSRRLVRGMVILLFAVSLPLGAAPVIVERGLPQTGVNLSRPTGGWINVDIAQHRFLVSFFDANKKQVPIDRARGLVRFYYTNKENRAPPPLNPTEDGRLLVSPARVLPPHVFHVHLVLMSEGSDEPLESYNFRYPDDLVRTRSFYRAWRTLSPSPRRAPQEVGRLTSAGCNGEKQRKGSE